MNVLYIDIRAWLLSALLIIFAALTAVQARAEDDGGQLLSKSLDELMEMEVSVTSKSNQSIREAPGIVSVVTREQIENFGARDLIDVLRMIPGIQYGVDVQGVTGIGIRGLWGHEGKVLLIWDGHEVNELLYSTTQFGGHYPVDEIERIEIIRGPGSVLYGGYAELAVINVVTRDAETLDGAQFAVRTSGTTRGAAGILGDAVVSKKDGDLRLKAAAFAGDLVRSDRTYTDVNGASYAMKDHSPIRPQLYSFDIGYKNLDLKLLADSYRVRQRDQYAEILPEESAIEFDSYDAALHYHTQFSPDLKLSATAAAKSQYPWSESLLPSQVNVAYDRNVRQYEGQLAAEYRYNEVWSGLLGVDYSFERAVDRLGQAFSNGRSSVSYWDYAAFSEVEARLPWANFRAGVRVDRHQQFGTDVVPRLAVTKSYDRFNFKLLASSAYRTPGVENINLNQLAINSGGTGFEEIEPEKTTVYEFEAGYKLTDTTHVALNLFDMHINKPITYFVDDATDVEGYRNSAKIGSRGAEVSFQWVQDWGYLNFNYSYYRKADTDASTYEVPGHSNALLGFAQHKLAGFAHVKLGERLSLDPSVAVVGDRYGFSRADPSGVLELEKFSPVMLTNVAFSYTLKTPENLKLIAGIANVFDDEYFFVQPYDNGHAPLPGLGREYWIKAIYRF